MAYPYQYNPNQPYQDRLDYLQSQRQPQQQAPQIQYVNNRQSAEQYQLPPNSNVLLMDSTQSRFYVKTTDASGMQTVKSYDFIETIEEAPVQPQNYVTRAEFDALKATIEAKEQTDESTTGTKRVTKPKSTGTTESNS